MKKFVEEKLTPEKNENKIQNFILKYRKISIIMSGCLGFLLAYWSKDILILSFLGENFKLLVLSLPTAFLLWFFRTYDVKEQITESRKTNNFNSFSNATKLFLEKDNIEANSLGLKLLMKQRNEKNQDGIDLITQYAYLRSAKLSGADLSNANLSNANLVNANLLNVLFKNATYDKNTTFPENFKPKEAGMIKVEV